MSVAQYSLRHFFFLVAISIIPFDFQQSGLSLIHGGESDGVDGVCWGSVAFFLSLARWVLEEY